MFVNQLPKIDIFAVHRGMAMNRTSPKWDREDRDRALDCLRRGGTLLYPTDTIWGLGADAENSPAVRKLFEIKERPPEKTMIILIADLGILDQYLEFPSEELRQRMERAEKPTTFIAKGGNSLPSLLQGPGGTLAVRYTRDAFCRSLIQGLGRPLVSSSANISGQLPPENFAAIDPKIIARVDYCVQYRQEEQHRQAPSSIWRYEGPGQYTLLRP